MSLDRESNFVTEALPAFIAEAQEQIQNLEQLLLELEDTPQDRDRLDALFRCAHTVKGSAGIFGLDRVVAFTHHVETLLDRLREGEIGLTPALSSLLLQCNDHLRLLIGRAEAADQHEDPPTTAAGAALVVALQAAARSDGTAEAAPDGAAPAAAAAGPRWHIAVAFGADTFRNGMDPLTLLNYVRGLGSMPALSCDIAAVPALDALDPENCHLAFELDLHTLASQSEIEGAFSFVRDDCRLHISAPQQSSHDLVERIEARPDPERLGEILVGAGAITRVQLHHALGSQAQAPGGAAPRLGNVLKQSLGVEPRVLEAALVRQGRQRELAAGTAGAPDDQRFIRVQAPRLDAVINLLGELVIAGAGAALLARQTRQRALMEANAQISRLVEEIRNGTLQLRMVPIVDTFSRFRRVVRDTAAELGKEVVLDMQGGETELDKSMVERIADPLMHLVRNALDHGLETPAERLAAGKAPQGRLTLSARHESGSILICIEDDGRGIQRRKVLERAWSRGLVEAGTVPDDEAILRLIFEPGFSTADKVTNLSGRGVGMDVVRRNIEALRGSVNLASDEGRGSRIEIRMPLTLAIIDGFLVGVGHSKFILPLDAVMEVVESRPALSRLDASGRGVVELRGQVLPVVDLRALYGLGGGDAGRTSVVVLRAGNRRFGVMVDQLLGQHQTVIKPLGRMFRSLRGMAGSSILGNGEVALIFDVSSLGQLAAEPPPRRSRVDNHSPEGQTT
jgi:two-component system chemotaxis sensor kinase CheA